MGKYIVGITGASGSVYGANVVEEILKSGHEVYLVVTDYGIKVFEYELEYSFDYWLAKLKEKYPIEKMDIEDMFAPIASGSFETDGMVIAPCSMGTLSKIACGTSDNLMIRAADVMLKEKRRLVLVPRETPLNSIHLRNMLTLSDMGVMIVPPMPAFYNKQETLEEIITGSVGRILKSLEIKNDLYKQWSGK